MTDFMKICLVGVELFLVTGQASMTKLMVAVHNFASTPNNNKIGYEEYKKYRKRKKKKENNMINRRI